jgi:GNAT superfamily N-acetyltransferase
MARAVRLTEAHMPSLCDFIVEMWRVDGPRSEMHLGDVFVTLYFDASGDLGSSTALWFDEPSRLVGAAFFTGATSDMVVRPEAASSPLAVDMIDWAMAEAKRRNPNATSIRVQRRPSLPQRVAFLEQLGFARMDSGALAFTRPLNGLLPEPSLPDGFVCRPLVAQDVPSWIRAFNDAFPGAQIDRRLRATDALQRI